VIFTPDSHFFYIFFTRNSFTLKKELQTGYRGVANMRTLKLIGARWIPYVGTTLLIAAMTVVMSAIGLALDLVNIALLFLLPVLLSAVLWNMRSAIYAAILGALSFDFFFVSPVLSFIVAELRYLISFGVYLAVAILTASLAARLKRQLLYSNQREAHTAALYELSKQLGDMADIHSLLENVLYQVSKIIGTEIAIYLPDSKNKLVLSHYSAIHNEWGQGEAEKAMAKLAFDYGEVIGNGSGTLRDAPGCYFPLRTESHVRGVLAIHSERLESGVTDEQYRMLEAICGLAASAIDRFKLADEARAAQLMIESERLRAAILDSVSHELRTPLAAIIGSATGLIEADHLFTPEDRKELLITVRDSALRMNRLVVNLLSMVRLESGMPRLQQNWCDAVDLIGVALAQVKDFQQHRRIQVKLPDEVPMLLGDEILLEQVLVNVISNSIKYSPDYSEININVSVEGNSLIIAIADQGIGLDDDEYERIFDKFYRAPATKHVTGTGLGLAICKGIMELHSGTITGHRCEPHGTVMTIKLPLPATTSDSAFNLDQVMEETENG
jgi:two-component system sensor histidine kinase KdpD